MLQKNILHNYVEYENRLIFLNAPEGAPAGNAEASSERIDTAGETVAESDVEETASISITAVESDNTHQEIANFIANSDLEDTVDSAIQRFQTLQDQSTTPNSQPATARQNQTADSSGLTEPLARLNDLLEDPMAVVGPAVEQSRVERAAKLQNLNSYNLFTVGRNEDGDVTITRNRDDSTVVVNSRNQGAFERRVSMESAIAALEDTTADPATRLQIISDHIFLYDRLDAPSVRIANRNNQLHIRIGENEPSPLTADNIDNAMNDIRIARSGGTTEQPSA